mgnify:FL=1
MHLIIYRNSGKLLNYSLKITVIAVKNYKITVMTVNLNDKNLSEIIKSARKKAGISQIQLAELAGVGKTLIFNIENGRINAQFEKLLKIFRVLNLKLMA